MESDKSGCWGMLERGELIGEVMLAIEMGANIEDISLTIHAHPTLSETIANASEMLTKTITDLYIKNWKKLNLKMEGKFFASIL